jgi:hypothetical protein
VKRISYEASVQGGHGLNVFHASIVWQTSRLLLFICLVLLVQLHELRNHTNSQNSRQQAYPPTSCSQSKFMWRIQTSANCRRIQINSGSHCACQVCCGCAFDINQTSECMLSQLEPELCTQTRTTSKANSSHAYSSTWGKNGTPNARRCCRTWSRACNVSRQNWGRFCRRPDSALVNSCV